MAVAGVLMLGGIVGTAGESSEAYGVLIFSLFVLGVGAIIWGIANNFGL